jgi:hypothetical protein
MDRGEVILYITADGQTTIELRIENGSVWLTQLELAGLFQTSKQNISLHLMRARGLRPSGRRGSAASIFVD